MTPIGPQFIRAFTQPAFNHLVILIVKGAIELFLIKPHPRFRRKIRL